MPTRTILAMAVISFVMVLVVHSQSSMKSFGDAAGIAPSGKSPALSWWEYNPLSLLSSSRLAELKPATLPVNGIKFETMDITGLSASGDAKLDGFE